MHSGALHAAEESAVLWARTPILSAVMGAGKRAVERVPGERSGRAVAVLLAVVALQMLVVDGLVYRRSAPQTPLSPPTVSTRSGA